MFHNTLFDSHVARESKQRCLWLPFGALQEKCAYCRCTFWSRGCEFQKHLFAYCRHILEQKPWVSEAVNFNEDLRAFPVGKSSSVSKSVSMFIAFKAYGLCYKIGVSGKQTNPDIQRHLDHAASAPEYASPVSNPLLILKWDWSAGSLLQNRHLR